MEPYTDAHLRILVNIVNNVDLEIPITLAIPGGILTGNLIGFGLWATRVADAMKPADKDGFYPYTDYLRVQALALKEGNNLDPSESDATHEEEPRFIHVGNVRFVGGEGVVPLGKGLIWRGKLSDVSGWAFGSMEPAAK